MHGISQGNNQTVPSSTSGTLLLDRYTGAAAAFSLRKLRSSTVHVIKVRRASDDAEKDFTPGGINSGALAAWASSGDAFVTTWYDQSGNANNAVNTTDANQPRIVASGVLDTEDGEPAIRFQSGTMWLYQADIADAAQPTTHFAVWSRAGADVDSGFVFDATKDDGTSRQILQYRDPENLGMWANGWCSQASDTMATVNVAVLNTCMMNGSSSDGGTNGGTEWNGVSGLGAFGFGGYTIGANKSHAANFLNGRVQELICYTSNKISVRTGIEGDINAHYGIY